MKINRREVLAGIAASPALFIQQDAEKAAIDPTLYIPKAQLVEDRTLLHDFMDENPFVELVTTVPTLRITHIPVLLERTAGTYGRVFGHISRQNPQNRAFDGSHAAVLVFRGPHGYISPAWFAAKESVPTWNFAVVHASGRPRAITDKSRLHQMLGSLIDRFEKYQGSSYDFSKLPEAYVSSLLEGIVGFEMEVESLEGKFKLGQNWSAADKETALARLREGGSREPSLYEFSTRFFSRLDRK
jgi:transcriptional regulator